MQVVNGQCRIYYMWPSREIKITFGILLTLAEFFIPFTILLFCHGNIVWMLSDRINKGKKGEIESVVSQMNYARKLQRTGTLRKSKFQIARRNVIKTLLVVGLCFIICWIQNKVIYLMYYCGYDLDWNSSYYQVTVLMAFSNSAVNPFIYLTIYKDYQIAIRLLFRCERRKRTSNVYIVSSPSNDMNIAGSAAAVN